MDIATILATCNDRPQKTNNALLAELAGTAPAALDTITELANALNDDENFVTNLATTVSNKADTSTVNSALALKADVSALALKANKSNPVFEITSTNPPTNNLDLTIEATSDTTITFKLKGSDGTVRSGTLTLS